MLKRAIPTAGLAILPKSGHGINLEEPALFNPCSRVFFRRWRRGAGAGATRAAAVPSIYGPIGKAMSLIVEKRGAVGWIVFNQPAKRNAINGAMWRGIPRAMAQYDADPDVRCVAFRGAGTEAFASGADISEFDEIRAQKAAVAEYDGLLDQRAAFDPGVPQAFRRDDLRLLHGRRPGDGACVRPALLRPSAQFGIPAAKLGLAYNVEGHKRLMETVGHARAREIMFLGRRYAAEEAFAMGLVIGSS